MLDAKGLVKEVRLLAETTGSEVALLMVVLLFTSFCIYMLISQNAKHNKRMSEQLKIVQDKQEECDKDRERQAIALSKSEKRCEELNDLNKESQKKIRDAHAAQEAMSKMLTDMFSKVMDVMK